MAVSNSTSDVGPLSPWYGQFPLTLASLRVGELESGQAGGQEVRCHGGQFLVRTRIDAVFERTKGENFSNYEFGSCYPYLRVIGERAHGCPLGRELARLGRPASRFMRECCLKVRFEKY